MIQFPINQNHTGTDEFGSSERPEGLNLEPLERGVGSSNDKVSWKEKSKDSFSVRQISVVAGGNAQPHLEGT